MSEESRVWKCSVCGKEIVPAKIMFEYMGRKFGHEVPACPECGRVFISRELAKGKMAEVEALMEDK